MSFGPQRIGLTAMPLHLIGHLVTLAVAPAKVAELSPDDLALFASGNGTWVIARQPATKTILREPSRNQGMRTRFGRRSTER